MRKKLTSAECQDAVDVAISRLEASNRLSASDKEVAHGAADDALLELLRAVLPKRAYSRVYALYGAVEKWYG